MTNTISFTEKSESAERESMIALTTTEQQDEALKECNGDAVAFMLWSYRR